MLRAHCFAKTVHHEPGRLVRDTEHAMDLMRANAFLGRNQRNSAASHLDSGILERSNTVPTVTVNCSRHALH